MPAWLTALIAIIRAWLGIKADIAQKQSEHVGEVMQQNVEDKAIAAQEKVALAADANAPTTKADKLKALESGENEAM